MMTYAKMIRLAQKRAVDANMEEEAIKWIFMYSDYKVDYSCLNEEVSDDDFDGFNELVDQYVCNKIPPQYIVHCSAFYGYDFYVDERCFIPRNETEQLVEETILRIDKIFNDKPVTIADVCSGSGVMGITLKKEIKNSSVSLFELSKDAVEVININKNKLKADVNVVCGDFITPILENNLHFDILVCNPPYIKNDEKLDPLVVDNEPKMALFGGKDGLDFYRIIFAKFDEIINDNGFMAFEFGYDQRYLLEDLIKADLPNKKYEFLKDYAKLDRMLFIYK